jgi:hypothetical protein
MSGKLVPLGHKDGPARETSRVRAVTSDAQTGPATPSRERHLARVRQARARIKNAHAVQVQSQRASSTHLRPSSVQNRVVSLKSGINNNEQMAFGSRG